MDREKIEQVIFYFLMSVALVIFLSLFDSCRREEAFDGYVWNAAAMLLVVAGKAIQIVVWLGLMRIVYECFVGYTNKHVRTNPKKRDPKFRVAVIVAWTAAILLTFAWGWVIASISDNPHEIARRIGG